MNENKPAILWQVPVAVGLLLLISISFVKIVIGIIGFTYDSWWQKCVVLISGFVAAVGIFMILCYAAWKVFIKWTKSDDPIIHGRE